MRLTNRQDALLMFLAAFRSQGRQILGVTPLAPNLWRDWLPHYPRSQGRQTLGIPHRQDAFLMFVTAACLVVVSSSSSADETAVVSRILFGSCIK
ncbi:MAG TPA: hypothetical protein VMM76_03155, partial [Pirellulaceae bacterium]|nr:hypothetical protein [Pirellulaceae bacterium]